MRPANAILPAMACPACGAENPHDARFCNQCGARIAPSDEGSAPSPAQEASRSAPTGAPNAWDLASIDMRPPTQDWNAPSPMPDISSSMALRGDSGITQEALVRAGLQRRRRSWPWLLLGAIGLFALGASSAWWIARSLSAEETGTSAPIRLDDIDVMDLPEGHPPPDGEVDLVTGTPSPPGEVATPLPPPAGAPTPAKRTHRGAPPVTTVDFRSGSAEPPSEAAPPTPRRRRGQQSPRTGVRRAPRSHTSPTDTSGSPAGHGTDTSAPSSTEAAPSPNRTESDRRRLERAAGGAAVGPADRAYARQVAAAFRRYWANHAKACFSQATRNRGELTGRVVLRMTIAADGSVARAEPASNTTGDEGLGRCLAHRARRWRFPPPPDRRPARVDLPLAAR